MKKVGKKQAMAARKSPRKVKSPSQKKTQSIQNKVQATKNSLRDKLKKIQDSHGNAGPKPKKTKSAVRDKSLEQLNAEVRLLSEGGRSPQKKQAAVAVHLGEPTDLQAISNDLHRNPSAQQTTRNLGNLNQMVDSGISTPVRSLRINANLNPIQEESSLKFTPESPQAKVSSKLETSPLVLK